ncbi:MAG TPA: hypothetical protein VGR47_21030 [Terracidiphilus sp.]|nr:hypothetical protein [Terracidiphilus sp.]
MNAAGLIACLVALEHTAGKAGDHVTRDFVIEAQDWILRTQKENLDLRRENHVLRLRTASLRSESEPPTRGHSAMPPFIFRAIAQAKRLRDKRNPEKAGNHSPAEFARAI